MDVDRTVRVPLTIIIDGEAAVAPANSGPGGGMKFKHLPELLPSQGTATSCAPPYQVTEQAWPSVRITQPVASGKWVGGACPC